MKWQKGSDNMEALTGIAIIFLVLFLVILPNRHGGPVTPQSASDTQVRGISNKGNLTTLSSGVDNTNLTPSSWAESIGISSGNASYVYQPSEEYISIENWGESAVNITGWKLRNAKDKRTIETGGRLRSYLADEGTIPSGVLYIPTNSSPAYQNIVLNNGERAIVTTGKISLSKPYAITSFKENVCTGYLENDDYTFVPNLNRNCPEPSDEPGVEGLSMECQDFIDNMSSCHTPDFETRDASGNICRNCADGVKLTPMCIKFLKDHYTYKGCIANHLRDEGFQGNTWRVYMGKTFEMWASRRETISLFDQFGRLVDSLSY
jgi:hypothetical protein